jgi:hypothetical protein
MPDANNEFAPVVESTGVHDMKQVDPTESELFERRRLGSFTNVGNKNVVRGFGKGYEEFDEDIHTGNFPVSFYTRPLMEPWKRC